MHRLQTLPRGCKPSPAPLAYSCTAALPSSSSRQLAGLPLLFLWASKSDVRHFAPPLNPPRAFKPFPAPLAYSCIAALLASGGSLGREPWNVQPVLLWASKSDVRHFKPLGSLAYSCTAALPSSSSRQLAGLPLLFLWASKSDVRHFAPPLNPPRAFKPFPAPLAYSCIAALLASAGSLGREPWNVQPVLLWASKSDVRHFKPLGSLAYSCTAALPSSSSRQLAGLPLLFLWASKSDVRHFAPPLNPPRGFKPSPAPLAYSCIAALPCLCVRREPGERASGTCIAALPASGGSLGREPLERAARALQPQRLWPTPASQPQPCPLIGSRPALRSACGSLGREPLERAARALQPQRLWPTPASQPQPCPLIGSRPALRSACGSLGREPLERAARALQPQRLWHTPASQPQPCPLIGSRPALRSACKPFPAPLAYSCSAALPASGGSLGREPWNVQPVLLWASKSDVRHFAPPSNPPPPRLQTLPSAFGLLLHRSLACVRREPGERALERAARAPMGFQKRR